jgi:hypothetical protein
MDSIQSVPLVIRAVGLGIDQPAATQIHLS